LPLPQVALVLLLLNYFQAGANVFLAGKNEHKLKQVADELHIPTNKKNARFILSRALPSSFIHIVVASGQDPGGGKTSPINNNKELVLFLMVSY